MFDKFVHQMTFSKLIINNSNEEDFVGLLQIEGWISKAQQFRKQ